ncbi:MAG: bifunctional phosphopantothenoylcysteine decarboxylase/phosphopantothenate--cysteine ligase CoaBC [Pseudomonadota bacterium]
MLNGRRILLIIGGGIAAYKSLELIRIFKKRGATVTPVLTRAAGELITPLSASALSGEKTYTHLFDLKDEVEMGHIELSRSADLIVVAPATADLMAKMATGVADDLASTVLLATDTPVMIAPAMNVRMWEHAATQRNLAQLRSDGIHICGPDEGDMACGEYGFGRMAEPDFIADAAHDILLQGPLAGKHIIVTSGPTHEPIDPVRYIANRSSGQQGVAIANALLGMGARVSFVTGPAKVEPPEGANVIAVETAQQMEMAVMGALPADAVICAAAVADWHVKNASDAKLKKTKDGLPDLEFAENPDILATVSGLKKDRPELVIGFAAETNDVAKHAEAKRKRKGCDWILANDVSEGTGIMGGSENDILFIHEGGSEDWPRMSKTAVGAQLATKIADALS